jgi:hypothetical protein
MLPRQAKRTADRCTLQNADTCERLVTSLAEKPESGEDERGFSNTLGRVAESSKALMAPSA